MRRRRFKHLHARILGPSLDSRSHQLALGRPTRLDKSHNRIVDEGHHPSDSASWQYLRLRRPDAAVLHRRCTRRKARDYRLGTRPNRRIVTADVALAESALDPITLGPKEGLAILNDTAVSTGVAALAIHDANSLAILSQLLTAMSVEALRGTDESFDAFFAAVRPHPGQIEAAGNIRGFLAGSKLVQRNDGSEAETLRQDRYPIRTAPQWLGPILEDLRLASQQITMECNSVTDNPLIDIDLDRSDNARILHGGNLQAKAITSAMEKVRLAAQTIGQNGDIHKRQFHP